MCCLKRKNSLVEVAPIQPHHNIAVSETSVICFKVADVLKLAFGHVAGAAKKTGQGFHSTRPDTSTKSAGLTKQHEGAPEKRKHSANTQYIRYITLSQDEWRGNIFRRTTITLIITYIWMSCVVFVLCTHNNQQASYFQEARLLHALISSYFLSCTNTNVFSRVSKV